MQTPRPDGARIRRSKKVVAACLTVLMLATLVAALVVERHAAYRQIALQNVADRVPSAPRDEARALALFDEILRVGSLDPGDAVIDDDPAGTLIRGWGFCDSIAMAFVQVAERLDLEGQLVFLKDPDTGSSPHTVATLKLDGEWRVFDVLYRAVSRDPDGSLATMQDVASGRAPITSSLVQAEWFEKPTVFYQTRPADSLRSHGRGIAREAVALLPSWGMRLAQDAYLRSSPPTYVETNGEVWEDWQDASDLDYWRARNYDVFGRTDEAEASYKRLMDRAPSSRHADSARTFLEQADAPESAPRHTTRRP